MDQAEIDKLSINQLRSLTSRLKLVTKGARAAIIIRITDFYDKYGWPKQIEMQHGSKTGSGRGDTRHVRNLGAYSVLDECNESRPVSWQEVDILKISFKW